MRPQLHLDDPWIQSGPRPFGTVVVAPHPKWRIFFSRSLLPGDLALGETLKDWLRSYNLNPDTVGDPTPAPATAVLNEVDVRVRRVEALVALATPRYFDERDVGHTSEWIPAETFHAVADRKPVLILRTADMNTLTGPLGILADTQSALLLDLPPKGDLAQWMQDANVVRTIRALRWLAEQHVGARFWHGLARNLPVLALGAAVGQVLLGGEQRPTR